MFFDKFKGARVLVTGHTGFKGSWLSAWLIRLGAQVTGVSIGIPTEPSNFIVSNLNEKMEDKRTDIGDIEQLRTIVNFVQPDYVFHLAAQSLVRYSYTNPIETYRTNVLGTAHVLESLRILNKPCVAVIITSDKCYDNVEWVWGYRETDRLGGVDPYSASKGAAEIIIRSYVHSFFPANGRVRIGIGRAGNVIGGGDWACDRIVPDCIRAWAMNKEVLLRNLHATRPWQHVLEPLSGYLLLAAQLPDKPELHGEPFNFGPPSDHNYSVLELVKEMQSYWNGANWRDISEKEIHRKEAGLLKLNCDKALHLLKWKTVMNFKETAEMTTNWYRNYYSNDNKNMWQITSSQIDQYTKLSFDRGNLWAK